MCEISVIVPVYNVEKYLGRCIDSILDQTFTDYEIVLVDDGTKDNSGLICDRYAEKYQCIRVIHQENKGLALARKTGIENAVGKYILFVDSDDWIHKNMLEEMYCTMVENQAELVCCQYTRVNEEGKRMVDVRMDAHQIICNNSLESAYQMFVTRYLSSAAWGKMIYAPLLKKVDFKGNLAIGEEHDMVTQLLTVAKRVIVISEGYYYYYWRTDSISHSGYNEKYYNSFKNYLYIRDKAVIDYNEIKSSINAYFAEYEMAVITAMCRNKTYDWNVIRELQKDLKGNIKDIFHNSSTPLYLKICVLMIIMCPHMFIWIFRQIHNMTGR